MVAIKSHQSDRIIQDPQKDKHAYLFYGTDEGRISENATLLAKNWSAKHGDGGEIIKIDDRSIADNPDIIAIEVRSVSMFGGFSVIRLALSNRIRPDLIKELIELKPKNLIILEAGNLKASSAMRKLFEKLKNTAAIPCFPDEARDIARLIQEELIDKGVNISTPARSLLTASLGSDRGISRQELIKLALYAHDKPQIEVEDVEVIIGDTSQLAYDQLITLIMTGQGSAALSKLDRLLASGLTNAGLTTLLGRHLSRLYKLRALMESGRQASDAVNSLRPPVHFKQRDAMVQQVMKLKLPVLKKAIHLVQETVVRTRLQSAFERISTERMILILSKMSSGR
ncbi:MAG: DNA polymerase III subunit delta [bacterium]|nr:DNA polymerase III subunit delta [bacterium]